MIGNLKPHKNKIWPRNGAEGSGPSIFQQTKKKNLKFNPTCKLNSYARFYIFVMNMIRTKYIYSLIITLSCCLLLSGCFIFRGKNKCDTCPSFNHSKKKKKH